MVALAPELEDALGQSLRTLSVGHARSVYKELAEPFGVRFPATAAIAGFHMVFGGRCWLELDSGAGRWLEVGDLALVPHGAGHAVMGRPGSATVPVEQLPADPPPGPHALLCGNYRFGAGGLDPVLALLPALVHVPARQVSASPGFAAVLHALREEVRATHPGHAAVVSSLVDAAFVYIVRAWFAGQEPIDTAWLGALGDRGLARALASIHTQPGAPWTVARLAQLARMSRAVFARRFVARVGQTPLAYVAARRLDLAARLLRETEQSLGQIATAVGYESEFALSRAFKRARDVAPGRYRKLHSRRA